MRDDEQFFGEAYFEVDYWPPGYWHGVAAPLPPSPIVRRCPHRPKYHDFRKVGKMECIDKNYWVEGKKLHWWIRGY